jgi:chemotaxis signal transduction protein
MNVDTACIAGIGKSQGRIRILLDIKRVLDVVVARNAAAPV